jgi:hypothetical protein
LPPGPAFNRHELLAQKDRVPIGAAIRRQLCQIRKSPRFGDPGDIDILVSVTIRDEDHRELRYEDKLDDDFVYNTVLDGLQNEGIATYVGYRVGEIFPNNEEPDYVMLDDPAAVRRKLATLNELFGLVGTVSVDSLLGLAWDEGVIGRAYYVVGAHMAKTIDEERGR